MIQPATATATATTMTTTMTTLNNGLGCVPAALPPFAAVPRNATTTGTPTAEASSDATAANDLAEVDALRRENARLKQRVAALDMQVEDERATHARALDKWNAREEQLLGFLKQTFVTQGELVREVASLKEDRMSWSSEHRAMMDHIVALEAQVEDERVEHAHTAEALMDERCRIYDVAQDKWDAREEHLLRFVMKNLMTQGDEPLAAIALN